MPAITKVTIKKAETQLRINQFESHNIHESQLNIYPNLEQHSRSRNLLRSLLASQESGDKQSIRLLLCPPRQRCAETCTEVTGDIQAKIATTARRRKIFKKSTPNTNICRQGWFGITYWMVAKRQRHLFRKKKTTQTLSFLSVFCSFIYPKFEWKFPEQ